MKTHTILGRDAILAAEKQLTTPTSFLRFAREIAYYHQERWDGSGYPEGLSGHNIPISARLMAVADTYDTLVSRRLYKPALPHEQVVAQIREGRGVLFDPDIVDAFLDIADEIQVIAARFADSYEDLQRELDRLEMAIVEDRIVLGGDS